MSWAGVRSDDDRVIVTFFSIKPLFGDTAAGCSEIVMVHENQMYDIVHVVVGEVLGVYDSHYELDSQIITTNGG